LRRSSSLKAASTAAGVVVAIALLEVGLRLLVSLEPLPVPRILADSFDTPVVARRQIDEGVATAHYSAAGARSTGNRPMNAGVTVVILGDSYVAAQEVADAETMGSQLERLARRNGMPLDVRQYGWPGASTGQYFVSAPDVLTRWNPRRVIVTLGENDFDGSAFVQPPFLRVSKTGARRIVSPPIAAHVARPRASALLMLMERRWNLLRRRSPSWARVPMGRPAGGSTTVAPPPDGWEPPDSAEFAALPDAAIRALSEAYGPLLSVVYLAEVGLTGDEPARAEVRLLAACRARGVTCVSTRGDMLEARGRGLIAHGLSTRSITQGHLNPGGHGVVAETMWKLLRSDGSPSPSATTRRP
jgi:lysophospholipase L1-like esterase